MHYCRKKSGSPWIDSEVADSDQAIILKSDYDKAYALRGILKIDLGEKKGCVDLEKAGQLGYQHATVFLKKYCTE